MTTLIVFSGLPASGKSTIARPLALKIGAVWLRIDSIEQALRESDVVPGSLDDAGYRSAYAVAEDNLRLGRDVVADSVNPWMLTRRGARLGCAAAPEWSRWRPCAAIARSIAGASNAGRPTCPG